MFGFGGRRGPRRGADLRMAVTISLEDALTGLERELSVPKTIPCRTCDGSGAKPGTCPVTCTTCAGHGQVVVNRGFHPDDDHLPVVPSTGQVIADLLYLPRHCARKRRMSVFRSRSPQVDRPRNETHRLSGQGEVGPPGSQPGDLYVIIRVAEHSNLERHGDDLLGLSGVEHV